MKLSPVRVSALSQSSARTATLAKPLMLAGNRHKSTLASYIVTPKQLSDAIVKDPRIVPVCASWFLPNDPQKRTGQQVFREQRIPKARFFDLDDVKDLESPYPHMLPTAEDFAKAMEKIGIKREDKIVVYDSKEYGIFSAPRVGWTFRVFGHPTVHVLNNFRLWVEQGHPTEIGEVETAQGEPGSYPVPSVDPERVVKFAEVKDIARHYGEEDADGIQILDARSRERWAGSAPEPRPGLPSGHIPGSLSIPLPDLLDRKTGALLPGAELRKVFESKGVDAGRPIISSCGTGVTAAVIDAALAEAEYGSADDRRLYDGSWTLVPLFLTLRPPLCCNADNLLANGRCGLRRKVRQKRTSLFTQKHDYH